MTTTSLLRSAAMAALLLPLALASGACAGGASAPATPAPRSAPSAGPAEPELTALLDAEVLEPERELRIRQLDSTTHPLPPRLANVASDTAAPPFARGNALLLLGRLGAVAQLPAFAAGLRAEDPNVRAAAATALEGYLDVAPNDAMRLLRRALRDEDAWVQARALQSLGPRDPALLRRYLAAAPNEELRGIARSLLQLAEERGAPLSSAMAAGEPAPDRLERTTSGGHTLIFEAERAWDSWGAAAGRLAVVRPSGDTLRMGGGVEVVAGVVPAFFSPDERWLVYEAEREIRVRDLQSGAERVVGAGVAPRPLPFSERFLLLSPSGDPASAEGPTARLEYAVLALPFAGDAPPERLGTLTARASMRSHGYYAPVRWMVVSQEGDRFFLEGEQVDRFPLPDPFGGSAGTP